MTDYERIAYEAEMRYARTGLTIDAEKAVAARRRATGNLSPMARRVAANKADHRRTGGDRPMGADASLEGSRA